MPQPSESSSDKPSVALSHSQENLTPLADKVQKQLNTGIDVLHVIGKTILGSLWMTLFESTQDAIVLGLLVKIPTFFSEWVLGKKFSGLDACWQGTNIWSIDRYSCYAVVAAEFSLWVPLIIRILRRTIGALRSHD